MISLVSLIKRNIKIFLRDKMSVFFSLLSVFIIIGLYALFLGEMQVINLKDQVGDIPNIRFLVDSWIIAGIVVVNSITTSLGALGLMIKDKQGNNLSDFLVSPLKRNTLVLGYLISSWIIAFILTTLAFVLGEFYIVSAGGEFLSIDLVLKVLGLIMLSVISFSSFLFFVLQFLKTENSFGTFSTITGTFIGFLTGIYIPIGVLGENIQFVIKLFTPSHMVVIMRNVIMEKPMTLVFDKAPSKVISDYKSFNGMSMELFGHNFTYIEMILYIILVGVLFYGLSIYKINKLKRKWKKKHKLLFIYYRIQQ